MQMRERNVPKGIKVIFVINSIINLLLIAPAYFVLRLFGPWVQCIGFLIILTNITLGFGIKLLNNMARVSFIMMQIVGLIFSVWPFMCFLTIGLGNPSAFGDNYEVWAEPFTYRYIDQSVSFILGMSIPALPMLFSIFCVFYLLRPSIKMQFK